MFLCYAGTQDLRMYLFLQEDSETSHTTALTSTLRTAKLACCLCTGFIHVTCASEAPWIVCCLWRLKQSLATAMSVLGGWWYVHTSPLPPGPCQGLRWPFLREGREQRLVQKPGYFSVHVNMGHAPTPTQLAHVATKCTCAPPLRDSNCASPCIFQKIDKALGKAVFIPSLQLQIFYRARD